ncbi:MAG: AbrB/MazE/SpoVT family DNA-binding domain-containing protein [Candidatus Poribacteria bacterium]
MELLKINDNGQITIPSKLRNQIGLEKGSFVSVELLSENAIKIIPVTIIVKGEERYYTSGWMEAEREATEAYRKEGLKAYNSVDEMMDELEKGLK